MGLEEIGDANDQTIIYFPSLEEPGIREPRDSRNLTQFLRSNAEESSLPEALKKHDFAVPSHETYSGSVANIGMNSLRSGSVLTGERAKRIFLRLETIIAKVLLKALRFINTQLNKSFSNKNLALAEHLNNLDGSLISGQDLFKVASKEYGDEEGNCYARQTLTRESVKENHLNMMTNMRDYLERVISESSEEDGSDDLNTAIQELNLCRREIRNLESLSRGFVSTNYVRDMLEQNRDLDYSQAVENICFGAPVNQRFNQVEINEQVIGGHCDLGVIAYHGNCLTNLKELKELATDPGKLAAKRTELEELRGRVAALPETLETRKGLQAIDHAIKQLTSSESINSAIVERRFFLKSQFLHLLEAQVKENPQNLDFTGQNPFTMVQLSLLNPMTKQIDTTGWTHHEENQLLDMIEIYNEFDQKKIVFGSTGPFIDAEGNIHLLSDQKEGEVTLETLVFNVSIQGFTENIGMQKVVNEQAINRMLERSVQMMERELRNTGTNSRELLDAHLLLQDVKQRLNNGESSYQLAEDLGYALTLMRISTSVNCLSAKDRTGYISTRIILRHIQKHLEELLNTNLITDKKYKQLKRQFDDSILSKDGCPAKNVYDNTGTPVLKCSSFHLPGYSEGKLGHAKRLSYYILQSGLILETMAAKRHLVLKHQWEALTARAA